MNENFDAFDEYAMKYDMNIKEIAYKYNHSYRVVHQAEEISRSIELDEEEKDLASLIALLHDIARFEQWKRYKSFSDTKEFDHGDEGVKILFEDGMIDKFIAKKSDYNVIKSAIKYHNKFQIPTSLSVRETLHSRIIRDADKLDIIYAMSTDKLISITDDDSEISEEVKEEFFSHNEIRKEITKSKNDKIILMLALIFDLNYDYSKHRVLDEEYLERILENLKNKKMFKPFIDEGIKYLKGELN